VVLTICTVFVDVCRRGTDGEGLRRLSSVVAAPAPAPFACAGVDLGRVVARPGMGGMTTGASVVTVVCRAVAAGWAPGLIVIEVSAATGWRDLADGVRLPTRS
jgi:hypothetical protein